MKSLIDIMKFVSKDTILEKLDINDIILNSSFPLDRTFKNVIKFLKDKGFNKISWVDDNIGRYFDKNVFDSRHGKFYLSDWVLKIIRFANTSKENISEKNPIYVISFNDDKNELYTEVNKYFENKVNEKEWLEKVNLII